MWAADLWIAAAENEERIAAAGMTDMVTAVQDRVFVQAHSRGNLFTGDVYSNDYMFVIDFNENGQIRRAREYFNVDTLRATLMPALLKWEAENGK